MKEVTAEEIMEMSKKAEEQQPQKNGVAFSLEHLIKFGRIDKEIEPLKGIKIKIHTLAESERYEAIQSLSDYIVQSEGLAYYESIKIPILAYAIAEFNGQRFETKEDKAELAKALKQSQTSVIDVLFMQYNMLLIEQSQMFEEGFDKKK